MFNLSQFSPSAASLYSTLKIPIRNGLAAGLVMAMISLFMPNRYKAEARILPGDKGGSAMGGMAAAAAAMGVSMGGSDSPDAAFKDILTSRWMKKKLVEEHYQFRTRAFYFGSWKEHKTRFYDHIEAKNMDLAVKAMGGILKVNRDLKSGLLTVTAETTSPELSHQIVRNALRNLEVFVQTKAQTKGSQKAQFTKERLSEAKDQLAKAEQEFTAFLNVHRNYATSGDPAIRMRGGRMEGEFKLRQQMIATLTMNYEQSLLEEKNDMPVLKTLDEGDVPDQKSGPARAILTLMMGFMGFSGSLAWMNKAWIKTRLIQGNGTMMHHRNPGMQAEGNGFEESAANAKG